MAMWDLEPEPSYRRSRRLRRRRRYTDERDLTHSSERLLDTTTNFMMAGIGVAAMTGLGFAVISALKPK